MNYSTPDAKQIYNKTSKQIAQELFDGYIKKNGERELIEMLYVLPRADRRNSVYQLRERIRFDNDVIARLCNQCYRYNGVAQEMCEIVKQYMKDGDLPKLKTDLPWFQKNNIVDANERNPDVPRIQKMIQKPTPIQKLNITRLTDEMQVVGRTSQLSTGNITNFKRKMRAMNSKALPKKSSER